MNVLSGREWVCVAAGAALFYLNQRLLRLLLHHDHDNQIDKCIENSIKGNELTPHAIVDFPEVRSTNGIGNESGAEEKETMQNISIRDGSAPLCCTGAQLKPDPLDSSKRKGYLSWDDYFMAIAFLSSQRSKDPNCQVGACLVNRDKVILGIGYNGFPRGCSDDKLPWAKVSKTGNPLETKYPYVCHAEVNAILNTNHASAAGQRLYVTMFPCNECAKLIIQAGVAEVVYYIDKVRSADYAYAASKMLLSMAGVKVWKHKATCRNIILHFQ